MVQMIYYVVLITSNCNFYIFSEILKTLGYTCFYAFIFLARFWRRLAILVSMSFSLREWLWCVDLCVYLAFVDYISGTALLSGDT